MHHFEGKNADKLYYDIFNTIDTDGIHLHPRGKSCLELRPATYIITNPRQGLYTGYSRKLLYRIWAIELASYISGRGGIEYAEIMKRVSKNLAPFINPHTEEFDGAYGPKLCLSLPTIYNSLSVDKYTRQAVASIWHPGLNVRSLDVPCTVSMQFFGSDITEESAKLNMIVNMRSQDINWGWPYDVGAFTAMQCIMADALGWDVGTYYHFCGSLHLYNDARPIISSYRSEVFRGTELEIPKHNIRSWEEITSGFDFWFGEISDFIFKKNVSWRANANLWPQFKSTLENIPLIHMMSKAARGEFQIIKQQDIR